MINNKKVLAVIPARAGSKGLVGKNYKELNGDPLFHWSIDRAIQSRHIDTIVISSNCPKCKELYEDRKELYEDSLDARSFFQEKTLVWIDRPEDISTDLSKSEDALLHTIETLDEDYDIVVMLQPTSYRLGDLIDKCLEKYVEGGYDSLFTATKHTPFFWQKVEGKWTYVSGDHSDRPMRQEIPADNFFFHDCGNVYITDKDVLMETQCRIGSNPCVYEVSGVEGMQIDTEEDFVLMEKILKR